MSMIVDIFPSSTGIVNLYWLCICLLLFTFFRYQTSLKRTLIFLITNH